MSLDATTAQATSSILLAAITVHLLLTTVLQHDTRSGRIICVAFVTVTGTGVLTASLPGDGTEPELGAVAAGGITLAFGLLRSGLRLQQLGRSPQLPLAFGAAALTAASVALVPWVTDQPVPLGLSVLFSALFAAAMVRDSLRGPTAERPPTRVLQGVMALVTVTIVLLSALMLAGVVDWTGSTDVLIAIGTTVTFVLAALCVISLRAEGAKTSWWSDDDRGVIAGFDMAGAAAFRRDATDRMDRSAAAGTAVGLVWVEIEHLSDLAEAYGPVVRDRAIVHVGRVLRSHVPAFALLGHLGDGRFAVLTTARARRPIERVASAVRTGLDDRPDDLPVLIGCRIGTSVQGPGDPSLERLVAEAQARARRRAQEELDAPDPS